MDATTDTTPTTGDTTGMADPQWGAWKARFARRLRQALANRDMEPDRLATMCDVSEATALAWCRGWETPAADRLAVIATLLHVDVRRLLGIEHMDGQRDLDDAVSTVWEGRARLDPWQTEHLRRAITDTATKGRGRA